MGPDRFAAEHESLNPEARPRRRLMRATRASLLARAGSAAAVAVLAGGGVVATATAADAASHGHALHATTLSIKNKAIAHNHHHADAVTGVLRSRRKPVAGETVT